MTTGDGALSASGGVDASGPSIHEALTAAVRRLEASGARDEGLGRDIAERRVWGIPRRARVIPAGRVWRLGVLLLGRAGEAYATGDILRASEEVRRGYTAESARARAQRNAAARRGGFAEGDVVNVGWHPLDPARPDGVVLRLHDGMPQVRWNPRFTAGWIDLGAYLDERIELLLSAPGAE